MVPCIRYAENLRPEDDVILKTLAKDNCPDQETALKKIYNLIRPGDPPNLETAKSLLARMFFNPKRYDLANVGRYKINRRLKLNVPDEKTTLDQADIVAVIACLLDMKETDAEPDDIDHLGNRRIRSVGELLANQFSIGLARMARIVKERMALQQESEQITPYDLINARTVSAVIQSFFGSSQLSQFMDQTNPLAELTHKRRLSALGPGGLDAGARRVRGPRRPLHALRPDVSDRDARRSEHRTDQLAQHLRADQPVRFSRDAVPQSGERDRHEGHRIPERGRRGRVHHRPGQRPARRQRQVPQGQRRCAVCGAISPSFLRSASSTWTCRRSSS